MEERKHDDQVAEGGRLKHKNRPGSRGKVKEKARTSFWGQRGIVMRKQYTRERRVNTENMHIRFSLIDARAKNCSTTENITRGIQTKGRFRTREGDGRWQITGAVGRRLKTSFPLP